MCDLRVNEFVGVQLLNFKDFWKLDRLVLQHAPCSYVVEVDDKLHTYNRKFLKTRFESSIALPGYNNFNFDDSSNC